MTRLVRVEKSGTVDLVSADMGGEQAPPQIRRDGGVLEFVTTAHSEAAARRKAEDVESGLGFGQAKEVRVVELSDPVKAGMAMGQSHRWAVYRRL